MQFWWKIVVNRTLQQTGSDLNEQGTSPATGSWWKDLSAHIV